MPDSGRPLAEVDSEASLQIEGEWTKVAALRPGLRAVNVVVILLEPIGRSGQHGQHGSPVHTWLVADETGSVELALYDQHFSAGNIIRLLGGYASLYRSALRLYVGTTGGTIQRIGDVTMRYAEHPNLSTMKFEDSDAAHHGGGAEGGDRASDTRPGDWTCPACRANVFASKVRCFRCGEAKPAAVAEARAEAAASSQPHGIGHGKPAPAHSRGGELGGRRPAG